MKGGGILKGFSSPPNSFFNAMNHDGYVTPQTMKITNDYPPL